VLAPAVRNPGAVTATGMRITKPTCAVARARSRLGQSAKLLPSPVTDGRSRAAAAHLRVSWRQDLVRSRRAADRQSRFRIWTKANAANTTPSPRRVPSSQGKTIALLTATRMRMRFPAWLTEGHRDWVAVARERTQLNPGSLHRLIATFLPHPYGAQRPRHAAPTGKPRHRAEIESAPDRIRTCDLRFRRPGC
jgi:hypothetical protein